MRAGALALICWFLPLVAAAPPAQAQGIIRDAEIEHGLRELARPLAAQAGVSAGNLRVMLINDRSLNAFVADNQTIFIHAGLVLRVKTAAELQSVIAHELAHIANGHITRRGTAMGNARSAAMLGLILAAAAGAAGGGEAAAGVALGVAGSAQRMFLAHTRAEEASADQSGLRYMAAAGIDPQAAADLLELFRGQEALSAHRQDAYVRTHPLTRDRLRAVQAFVAGWKGTPRDDPNADYWFARAQAKLDAFTRNPSDVLRRAPARDTSDAATIRRAVAWHRQGKTDQALAEIGRLVERRPRDGFAMETRAQILLESRRFDAAARDWGRAAALAPNEPLILGGHGRALLAAGQTRAALPALERAAARDGADPRILRDLATAYAKADQPGMAALVSAERYALVGRLPDAGPLARRAAGMLAQGSPGWRRAQDIIRAAETAAKRSRTP
ncbi:MAG: M48 family metalloprotease [Paracoccaceae bacterium]|nr:MAG: M48 family metalloprotease [Paracoccaceae bacterium]